VAAYLSVDMSLSFSLLVAADLVANQSGWLLTRSEGVISTIFE
jgi:hypothetical protein